MQHPGMNPPQQQGLLAGAVQQAGGAAPPPGQGATANAGPQMPIQQAEATPAEQQEYDKVVLAATQILYEDEERSNKILQHIMQFAENDPAAAVADAAVNITVTIDEKMNGKMAETVVLNAALEILAEVIEITEAAQIATFGEAEKARAVQMMTEQLMDIYGMDEDSAGSFLQSVDPQQADRMMREQGYLAEDQDPEEVAEEEAVA